MQQVVSGTQQRGDLRCSEALHNSEGGLLRREPKGKMLVALGMSWRSPLRCGKAMFPIPKWELEKSDFLGH